jgi:hypothetical protein
MDGPPFFTDEIRAIAGALRGDAHSHARLNLAESRIDQLGRRLHGLEYVRGREIAGCFTAALRELGESHALPDERRGRAVHQAVVHLEAALGHAAAGVLPPAP